MSKSLFKCCVRDASPGPPVGFLPRPSSPASVSQLLEQREDSSPAASQVTHSRLDFDVRDVAKLLSTESASRRGSDAAKFTRQEGAHTSQAHWLSALTKGRFVNAKPIGKGAYGKVYEASDMLSGKDVAVKVVENVAAGHWQLTRRSIRELLILRRLRSHRGITALESVFTQPLEHPRHGRDLFMVLELCACDLFTLSSRRRFLSLTDVQSLLRDLLLAVGHAHAHGVLHRDIKPENCLVRFDGSLCLADFGLARIIDNNNSNNENNPGRGLGNNGPDLDDNGDDEGSYESCNDGEEEEEEVSNSAMATIDSLDPLDIGDTAAANTMTTTAAAGSIGPGTARAAVPALRPPPSSSTNPFPSKPPPLTQRSLTSHVVSRWYRAPELALMVSDYGGGVDVWSVGCVFFECLLCLVTEESVATAAAAAAATVFDSDVGGGSSGGGGGGGGAGVAGGGSGGNSGSGSGINNEEVGKTTGDEQPRSRRRKNPMRPLFRGQSCFLLSPAKATDSSSSSLATSLAANLTNLTSQFGSGSGIRGSKKKKKQQQQAVAGWDEERDLLTTIFKVVGTPSAETLAEVLNPDNHITSSATHAASSTTASAAADVTALAATSPPASSSSTSAATTVDTLITRAQYILGAKPVVPPPPPPPPRRQERKKVADDDQAPLVDNEDDVRTDEEHEEADEKAAAYDVMYKAWRVSKDKVDEERHAKRQELSLWQRKARLVNLILDDEDEDDDDNDVSDYGCSENCLDDTRKPPPPLQPHRHNNRHPPLQDLGVLLPSEARACCPSSALNLLRKMVEFKPSERVSAASALAHPFFTSTPTPDKDDDAAPTFTAATTTTTTTTTTDTPTTATTPTPTTPTTTSTATATITTATTTPDKDDDHDVHDGAVPTTSTTTVRPDKNNQKLQHLGQVQMKPITPRPPVKCTASPSSSSHSSSSSSASSPEGVNGVGAHEVDIALLAQIDAAARSPEYVFRLDNDSGGGGGEGQYGGGGGGGGGGETAATRSQEDHIDDRKACESGCPPLDLIASLPSSSRRLLQPKLDVDAAMARALFTLVKPFPLPPNSLPSTTRQSHQQQQQQQLAL